MLQFHVFEGLNHAVILEKVLVRFLALAKISQRLVVALRELSLVGLSPAAYVAAHLLELGSEPVHVERLLPERASGGRHLLLCYGQQVAVDHEGVLGRFIFEVLDKALALALGLGVVLRIHKLHDVVPSLGLGF